MINNKNIHKTAIIDKDVKIGDDTKIWHFSHIIKGSIIGNNCTIGQNVMIGPNVNIGHNCKVQNNVSIYNGITIEDDVFLGPSCVFTNVKTPRAFIDRSQEFIYTTIKKGASIGANATLVCGIEIGEFSMIAAGAVVTKNVKPYSLVIGSPAKHIGWVSKTGERLDENLICERTGIVYKEINGKLYESNKKND